MELVKVTRPQYLTVIAPRINDYAKHLKKHHILYENLFTYFQGSIQSALIQQLKYDISEFWVVMYEDKPRAFAHWMKRPLPHIGKVYMDAIHNWSKSPNAVGMLLDQFIEFGKQHRSTVYETDCLNEAVYRHFKKVVDQKGYTFDRTGWIHCIGMKKEVQDG